MNQISEPPRRTSGARWRLTPKAVAAVFIALGLIAGTVVVTSLVQLAQIISTEGTPREDPGQAALTTELQSGREGSLPGFGSAREMVVYVTGAVNYEGVHVLPAGSRVHDAIEASGGLRDDAATDQVNLARELQDGEQIHILTEAESASGQTASTPQAGIPASADAGSCIDLNTAAAPEWEAIDGIGPTLARRIVDYRDEHGPFSGADALLQVRGVGPAVHEAALEMLCAN